MGSVRDALNRCLSFYRLRGLSEKAVITINDFPLYKDCVITEPNGDMGDSPQRTFGLFHVGKLILSEEIIDCPYLDKAIDILQDKNGNLIRDPVKWNDPNDIPADQFDPTVIGCTLGGFTARSRFLLHGQISRFGFYPNGNPPNLGSLSSLVRAWGSGWLWPLIFVLDVFFFFAAIIDCARAKQFQFQDGSWLDMDNAVVKIAQAELYLPTPLSWLTRKTYVWFYPQPMSSVGPPLLCAIRWKYRNGNYQFGNLWNPTITRWYS